MSDNINLAVTYARVSTKDQERTGHTLPIQSKNMEEYAQKKGLTIVKEFVVAESASKKDRKHYQQMWAFLEQNKKVKHIIFEEIDRFTRNDKDKLHLLDKINGENYIAHFVMEKLALDKETSPNDIFLFDILVAKAKNYSAALSQKVKKGQQGKLEKGGYPGGYPSFGYKKINGELYPQKPYSLCVAKIFELYTKEQLTLSQAAKRLNEMGFRTRTGKRIVKSFVHEILINPIYTGIVRWNGKIFLGKHKPLIDKNCFRQADERLNRKTITHWYKHDFTYRGFIRCGECDSAITAETHKGFIYYHCTYYRECAQRKYTREEDIEKYILDVLDKLYLGDKAAGIVKDGIIVKRDGEEQFRRSRLEDLKQGYQQIISWVDKAYDDKNRGIIDEEMYIRKSKDYLKRKEEIGQSMEDYANGKLDTFELPVNIVDLANRAPEIYKRRTPQEKRLLLKILVSNAILKDQNLNMTLRPPFNYIVEYKKTENWSGRADLNRRPHT